MHRGVQRLHGRVSQERQLVGGFELVAAGKSLGDVAFGFRDDAVLFTGGAQILPDIRRADPRVRRLRPR